MCLTIPGQVIKIKENNKAQVRVINATREVNVGLIKNVKVGDWLLSTTGLAVKKINNKEAKELLKLLNSRGPLIKPESLSLKFRKVLESGQTRELTKKEITYLLEIKNKLELEALYSEANTVRQTYLKDFICLHGIIEFSNYCQNNCLYCGLRRDNKKLKRYRMTIPEIVAVADQAVNKIGYKMLVLQSGLDYGYSDKELVKLVTKIRAKCQALIIMSVGERSLDCYKKMKQAGANGVLFRFESSNPKLYKKLHPEDTLKGNFADRFTTLRALKKMGYYISTGPIIGLPGQTVGDLADDILLMKKMKVNMLSMGPFIPCDNTPLENNKPGELDLALKMIAVSRLVIKKARIPVTSAMETLDAVSARKRGLSGGANSLMFNLTPAKYRKDYKIYNNKFYKRDKDLEDFALYKGKESWAMLEREFRKYLV